MKTQIQQQAWLAKKEKLSAVTAALKQRFIGLDDVIDETMLLLMPWYLFPEAQRRPAVINLWGLTGSGKTALVESIVALLEFENVYAHFDMGEFESKRWLKNIFTNDLEHFHAKPSIICLDEFQFAKTLSGGKELQRDSLRVVWELLDSGKLNYISDDASICVLRADQALTRLEQAEQAGVRLVNGEIADGQEAFLQCFKDYYFDESTRYGVAVNKSYFLSRDFVEGVKWLFDNNPTFMSDQIRERIKQCSLTELKVMLLEGIKTRQATKQLDLSHAFIFVLGNLDEAYLMNGSMNPDISADDFHQATVRITVATIKTALRERFRSEQIARLGNNHIIYKSFRKEHFQELIRRELNRVAAFAHETFGWTLIFDESVVDIVYAEGVFPTQGTRPVFTTIGNLIESRTGKVALAIFERGTEAASVLWRFADDKFQFTVQPVGSDAPYTFEDKVSLKVDTLRKVSNKNLQAHVAVHEAGHAVLAALTFRIVPGVVVSKTAAGDAEGFCLINYPEGSMTKDSIRKDIIVSLGGYAAERLVFGDSFTSAGVSSDIEYATELANKAIRKFAMGTDPIRVVAQASKDPDLFYHDEHHSQQAVALINDALKEADRLLARNKLLLLKMAQYLTVHTRMEEATIADFVTRFSVEDWVRRDGFVKKEDYYDFHAVLENQLNALEQAGSPSAEALNYLSLILTDKELSLSVDECIPKQ
ncbi:hypothetical protein [Chryseolinea lacunae]|uniref:Peptidase M41 domain-containing protein n=1 Tax=Chryseolinea lacunae TaxID=2801331 RepID=A0ABS1KRN4_9BACT|nr:hypothetical protein [Chryseolinea lacunae]MBL0742024.1 hypothetical protein [Chryseolinea lacunae]